MNLDFVIVGGMKCSSTAAGTYLSLHPEVNFCNIIETNYFSYNSKNIQSLEEYFKIFYEDKPGLKGESSPTYSNPDTLASTAIKLKKNFPDIKVIILVRNPLKRIESHINHLKLQGLNVNGNVEELFDEKPDIVDKSRFGFMVDEYIKVFGREHFHVVKFEELLTGCGLKQMCNFLNLEPVSEALPPVNKTDMRYIQLPIIDFYKKNWLQLQKIPGLAFVKKPLKSILDRTFSKKLGANERVILSERVKQKVIDLLEDDNQLFDKHYGFSLFDLKK